MLIISLDVFTLSEAIKWRVKKPPTNEKTINNATSILTILIFGFLGLMPRDWKILAERKDLIEMAKRL